MKIFQRLTACLGSALLLCGCYTYGALISVPQPDLAPPFTLAEQEAAKAITIEIAAAAGFWQTDTAEKLETTPSSWPYIAFVSLGAPGGEPERRHVSILGSVRKDRRELQISVGDSMRGDPTPATAQLIEDLRAALERVFPGSQVQVTHRKKLHLLAP